MYTMSRKIPLFNFGLKYVYLYMQGVKVQINIRASGWRHGVLDRHFLQLDIKVQGLSQ